MRLSVEGVCQTYLPPAGMLRHLVRGAARSPVPALRSVSFSLSPGSIVGLVGPNGAGKTTLIRIIATLLHQSSGAVKVGGFDTRTAPQEARRRLGLVLEGDRGLYDRLSGFENLEFFGVMSGLRPSAARVRAAELLEAVGLTGRDKLVFGYSSGMRSRLSLARALLIEPPLLVLDEPTRSLDPIAGASFVASLRAFAERGGGVLLSSHRLDEVVSVCSRVVVLVGGQVRHDAPVSQLARGSEDGTASALAAFLTREAALAEEASAG